MLKGNRIYIFVLITAIIILVVCSYLWSSKEEVWKQSYSSTEKKPFGTALVYQEIASLFAKKKIEKVDKPIYNFLKDKKLKNTNYLFIGNEFAIENADMRSLLSYVAEGNQVFIAANSFSYQLEDTLGFYTSFSVESMADLFKIEDTKEKYEHTLVNKNLKLKPKYLFKGINDAYQIVPVDTTAYKVLAIDNAGNPVYVKTKYGEGIIYLHSFPLAFTNYYLLFKNNQEYIASCLSYLPNQTTFWDDYYKVPHQQNVSKLSFIKQQPALLWAWYLLIASSLIYVLFRLKRQQRVIPSLVPYENSSLEFATTIGRLYHSKKDHKDIVKKQATYWLAYIRSKLNIPTNKLDSTFVRLLSEKSKVSENEIQEIIHFIAANNSGSISERELMHFYTLIQNFYQKTKR